MRFLAGRCDWGLVLTVRAVDRCVDRDVVASIVLASSREGLATKKAALMRNAETQPHIGQAQQQQQQ